jgi:NADH dehydrogenase
MTERIVILGGGFAGVSTAQELARRLRREKRLARRPQDHGVSITLINRENYFVFQPLLADIISGAIETTHVVVPLRRMLRDVEVEVGYVEDIDPNRRSVLVRRRESGQGFWVEYDALVVALGSVTDFRAVPGMAEHAVGVRTLGDAFYLRNRALSLLEEASNESDADRRDALLTFVVVGGGSTGVEVAAELENLLRTAYRTFALLPAPRVVLVHSRPYVVPEFGERLGRYATKKLVRAGVRVVLGRRLTRVEPDHVELDDGSVVRAATVVSTVGNAPHPILARLDGALDARGWITADSTFGVTGLERVWALGDVASIIDPRTGRPLPATAQHAIREGPHAARNILAVLAGGTPTPFDYSEQGMLVSLGRFRRVGEILGIKVSGFPAWFLWRSYYLLRLPSLEQRIRVAIDWALELFPRPRRHRDQHAPDTDAPGRTRRRGRGRAVSVGARADATDEIVV